MHSGARQEYLDKSAHIHRCFFCTHLSLEMEKRQRPHCNGSLLSCIEFSKRQRKGRADDKLALRVRTMGGVVFLKITKITERQRHVRNQQEKLAEIQGIKISRSPFTQGLVPCPPQIRFVQIIKRGTEGKKLAFFIYTLDHAQ